MTQVFTVLITLIAIQSVATTIRHVARNQQQQRSYAGGIVIGTMGLTILFWWNRMGQAPQATGWIFNLSAALIAIGLSALLMLFESIRRERLADSQHIKTPSLASYLITIAGILTSIVGIMLLFRTSLR